MSGAPRSHRHFHHHHHSHHDYDHSHDYDYDYYDCRDRSYYDCHHDYDYDRCDYDYYFGGCCTAAAAWGVCWGAVDLMGDAGEVRGGS